MPMTCSDCTYSAIVRITYLNKYYSTTVLVLVVLESIVSVLQVVVPSMYLWFANQSFSWSATALLYMPCQLDFKYYYVLQ
jgi:hypothetical protein